ncbi:MAG: OmpH family outer membrane protein [Alphaproteobacteria bacterium]|nr:OmpH family outer membrane protein [Alphaproteobacteria bacterium]
MKGVFKSVMWGSAVASLLAAAPVWAELKIGYVNYAQLMEQSPQAKVIADSIRSEFMPRQRELQTQEQTLRTRADKLQKDGATMTDDQRTREEKEVRDGARDLERKKQEAQDDFNARRNEELSRLQKTLIEEVRTYAKGQNFDLVLADGVIYAAQAIDITPAVLNVLQSHAPKGSAAPAGAAPKSSAAPSGAGPKTPQSK